MPPSSFEQNPFFTQHIPANDVTGEHDQEHVAEADTEAIEPKKENQEVWPKERYIEWAKSMGGDEEWINDMFTFNPDGTSYMNHSLVLMKEGVTEFPKGVRQVFGSLDLSFNPLRWLNNLPPFIYGTLSLIKVPAKTIPAGITVEKIQLSTSQHELIRDAKNKGYAEILDIVPY